MNAYFWLFLSLSFLIAGLVFLFLFFCRSNVLSKAISTILVLFAGVGGIKVTPEYRGNLKLNFGSFALDGQYIVGGSRTDTTILLIVLCVAFLATLWCFAYLKKHGKI